MDKFKTLNKKTIIAIVAICILAIVAIVGVVAFLKDDGSATAIDEIAQQEPESENANTNASENAEQSPSANENNSDAQGNTSSENTTNNSVMPSESANPTTNTTSQPSTSVAPTTPATGTTTSTTNTNVPNQEYVTSRVEEVERQISEDLTVSWKKMDIAGAFTDVNVEELGVTAVKKAYVINNKEVIPLRAENEDAKTVVPGDEIRYVIEIKNISKEARKGIRVSDVVPAQTSLIGISDGGELTTIDGVNKIFWTVDFEDGEEAKTVSFLVCVNEDATGTIRNTAVVNGDKTNETHNTIIDTTKTSEIVKCDREEFEGTTVHENDEIKYTVTIKNTGDIAEKVSVSDAIKEGLTYKEGSLEVNIPDVPVKVENGEVSLEDYELSANTTLQISFVATVNTLGENEDGSPITSGKIEANKVTVNSNETTDKTPDGGDKDYDVVKPYVVTSKVSKVVKCDDYSMIDGEGVDKVKTVHEGDEIEYTITVSNEKGTASDLVSLRDEIPEGLTFVADSLNTEAISAGVKVADNVLTLDDYTIETGAVLNITFKVSVNELGEDEAGNDRTSAKLDANKVIVNGDKENPKEDPDPPTDVKKPNISATKAFEVSKCTEYNQTGKVNVVHENDEIKYTITVSNTGDEKGTVNLTDTIKSGLSFISVTDNKGVAEQVTDADGNVTGIKVDNYELAAKDTLVITLVVKVNVLNDENDLVKVEDNKYVYKKVIDANVAIVNEENIPEDGGDKEVQKPYIETTKESLVSECTETGDLKQVGRVSTVHEGDKISYKITVSNEKGSASKVINVEDAIPDGLTLDESSVRVNKENVNITVVDNKISVKDYTLGAGEKLEITFNVIVATLGENDYVEDENGNETCTKVIDANYVVVNGDKEHPIPDPDGPKDVKKPIIETTKVSEIADCTISPKQLTGSTVHEGDVIRYTITVSNAKGSEAGIINLNDTIPDGLSISGNVTANLADAQAKIQVSGKTITLTDYKLQAGATLVITFDTVVDDLGTTTNEKGETVKATSATINANVVDVNGTTTPDSDGPKDVKKPNIEISKTSTVAGKDYVRVGESFDYIITAKNNGTEKGNAVITDTIPAEFTVDTTNIKVDDQDAGNSVVVSGNKVTWTVTDLAAGSSKILKIRVTAKDITGVKAETTNTATIDNDNPSSSTDVDIGKPDIDVTKLSQVVTCNDYGMTGSDIKVVHEKDEIQYTITVENNGVVSDKINVRDELKDKVEFVEGSLTAKVDNKDITGVKVQNGVISLDNYELAAGSKLIITFKVRVKTLGLDENGNKITKATFEANTVNVNGDPTEDPNGPGEIKKPDLKVTKTSSIEAGQYAEIGKQFSYYIVVDNNGDEKGSAVVEDEVPSNLRIDSYGDALAGDTISVVGNKVTWNVNNLPAKTSRRIEIKVTPLSISEGKTEETITNTAKITNGPDSPTDVTIATPIISTTKVSKVVVCGKYGMIDEDGAKAEDKVKTVHEGDEIEYTITISNTGKVAGIVNMNDPLPNGMTFKAGSLSTSLPNVNVVVANDKKSISLNGYSLAANTTLTITFRVTIDDLGTIKDKDGKDVPATSATLTANEVTVNGDPAKDPNPPTDVKKPMITATKETPAADEAYITENRLVEYTITVTNNGTEKGNATVTDVIDDRLEYKQSALVNKYDKDSISYDKTTKTVTWNVVDLPAGKSRTATITVWVGEITKGVSETIPNIVNVDGKPTDEETITVGKPSIKAEKTSEILECSKGIKEGTIVHEGDVIKYTIKVKNEGTLPKTISVTDTIKSGLTYVEGTLSVDRSNTGATITNGVLTITDYELPAGQEMTITFNVRVNELTDADYSKDENDNIIYSKKIDANVASVDGKSPSDGKEYEVVKPVINVKKEVSKTLVSVNEEFYYDITVTNVGTDVGNTVITDTIPSELIYNGFVKPTNDDVVTYDETTRLLTWNVNALKVNKSRTLRINVKAPADVTANPTTVTNAVYKDGSEKPEDSVDTKVAKPEITTTKSSEVTECKLNLTTKDTIGKEATTVHEGDVIKYTITITNSGEVAGTVNMNDSLPAGMTFKAGSLTTSLSNVNVVVANDKKSISLKDYSLAGNTTLTITFEVTIDNLGTVKDKDGKDVPATSATLTANTVTVNGVDEKDPNPPTTVKKPNIVIEKTSNVGNRYLNVDETFEYTITATNNGTEVGTAVVTDRLPDGVEYLSYTDNGDTVDISKLPEIKWTVKDLGVNDSRELKIQVKAKGFTEGVEKSITNTATIDNGNPSSEVTDKVGKPQISANKTSRVAACGQYGMIDEKGAAKVTTVHEGDEIEYTITITNSGRVAGIVNMNDPLPAGMTFKDGSLSTSIADANVVVASDKKSISLNDYSLAADTTLTITFRVTIDPLGKDSNGNDATSAKLSANTVTVNTVKTPDPNPPTDVKKPIINTTKTSVISECGKGQTSGTIVHEGDKIKYTITVSNSGTEYKNINVSDTLKSGVSLIEATISAKDGEKDVDVTVSQDKRTISLDGYRLEAGHTLTITFEVSVDTLPENTTKATIEANQVTVDTTTTTDDKTYEVVKPNINVTKQVLNTEGNDINGKTVDVRSTLKYVLVGTNTGDEDSNVTITDDIDISKLTDVTVTGVIRTNETDASTAVTYNKETGKLLWSGLLKKNSGNQVIITIEAKTRDLLEADKGAYTVENTAKYTPAGSTEKSTNKVTNNVEIMIESDKTAKVINAENDGKAEYGDIIEYTITAENKSASDGKVNIVDPLPTGVEYSNPLDGNANPIVVKVDGKTVGNGTYDADNRIISYNGTLKAGAKLTLTFKVKAIETNIENDIVNTATINGIEKSATVDVVKKISIAATAEVTKSMDLVLVLDVSGSMNGKRIDALKEAAKALVNKVFPAGANDTNSTVTIIAYNGNATEPVTYKYSNKTGAISKISNLKAETDKDESGTNIKAALDKANTVLTNGTLTNDKKVVIFLSDGAPTTPNDPTGLVAAGDTSIEMYQENSVENIVESAKNVKKNADRVYSIGLGTEDGLSDKCAYVTECSELADVITSSSSVDRNNNKVTITLRNSSSRDITVTELTVNISGITGVTTDGVTYTSGNYSSTLTWDNDIVVPANGLVSLEVDITRRRNSWVSISNITPEYERVCSNATHQAMNSVVPFDGAKYSYGKGYHYYTEKSLAKFVLKTIGKTKYIPVAEGADTTDTTNNLSKEFDAILKDSSTTRDTAIVTNKPTELIISETATVIGDVVLSIGETSYTINIDTLKNGAYSLVTGDELSYTPGVGFTFTIKKDKTLEKELHIAYTVDKK